MRRFLKLRRVMIQGIQIAVGTALISLSITLFLLPNQISSGGFAGLATVPYYFLSIPVGYTILVLNIPLFILALIKGGKKYFISALVGTVFLSVFLNLFESFQAVTTDRLLAAIYGGVVSGAGTAIILRANASTGGTDLLANIVKMFRPETKTSGVLRIADVIIVTINTLFFREIEVALYSVLAIFVVGKVLDLFFEGIDFSKVVYIISSKHEEISERIGKEIRRGVTSLYGKGTYTAEDKEVLFCACSRGEIVEIRKIVKIIDPKAFIIIQNAREVFGEGFKKVV